MFIELNAIELENWRLLSEEEKNRRIKEDEINVAVDVNIKIVRLDKITEEHKYYQVFSVGNCELIHDIRVVSINEKETEFYINTYNGGNTPQLLVVRTGEEKSIEVGIQPYSFTYKISVSNIKIGKVKDL